MLRSVAKRLFASRRARAVDVGFAPTACALTCALLLDILHDGLNLQYASPAQRDDMAIVAVAVAQNGAALQFASDRLRDFEEVVFYAVLQTQAAFEFASKRLRCGEFFEACSALQPTPHEWHTVRLYLTLDLLAVAWADAVERRDVAAQTVVNRTLNVSKKLMGRSPQDAPVIDRLLPTPGAPPSRRRTD